MLIVVVEREMRDSLDGEMERNVESRRTEETVGIEMP